MRPVLFYLWGVPFFSYPIFLGVGWGVAYSFGRIALLRQGLSLKGFRGLFWGSFLSSYLGAKALFLLSLMGPFAERAFPLLQNTSFWLGGGFVFFGGLLAGMFFWGVYSLYFRHFPPNQLFLLLPALAFGHAVGRVGCFLAGCCYGIPSELPWAILTQGAFRHPVPLYEALGLVTLSIVLWQKTQKRVWDNRASFFFYLLSYSLLRFCLEFLRGDSIRGEVGGWPLSQVIATFLMGISCFFGLHSIMLQSFWKRWKPK